MAEGGTSKLKKVGREAAIQIASGGSAGFVEICLMHPLDVVKTRFQVQSNLVDAERYRSIADCFSRMIRSEGFFSIYKGAYEFNRIKSTHSLIYYVFIIV